jgi:hypothetical protein
MKFGIQRVCLANDRQEMIEILKRNFGPIQEPRFDWRHSDNPAGESWSWFMYEGSKNQTVAMATVFPRHMRVDGKPVRAGQVGEFAVDPGYRSLGPAVLLQRTTFEPVISGELSFCYDCPPHDEGMSTFVRLGMRPSCEVVRYALPLRSDEYFAKRIGSGAWTKPLVAGANLLLGARRKKARAPGLEISSHEGRFGDEFTRLDEVASVSDTVRSSRSATDLNWRYVQDPLASLCLPNGATGKYRVLVARRGGELCAFIVFFIQSDAIASLVDLFGFELPNAGLTLLEAAIDVCRSEGVSSFHGFCSGESELKPLFETLGFRPRERNSRVVAYTGSGQTALNGSGPKMRWAFGQVEVML